MVKNPSVLLLDYTNLHLGFCRFHLFLTRFGAILSPLVDLAWQGACLFVHTGPGNDAWFWFQRGGCVVECSFFCVCGTSMCVCDQSAAVTHALGFWC